LTASLTVRKIRVSWESAVAGRLISDRLVLVLAAIAVVLLVATCAVLAFGAILGAMGDVSASLVLYWIAAGLGILLVVDIVCLILGMAVRLAEPRDEPPSEE